ncbi:MAG TPA: sigma 54-interacting transcriptional regulator, partial [Tissierellaceae bacterium]|nr:sigma 54-interacting transcriptional regulator [Tissierellaceae bacterium]
IPENLIESELFGHEKGAFTGAIQTKKGKFELAHKGTLFLDEIGELPLPMQVKFLRVLQEKQIYRIGSEQAIDVDVRIIAASNRDLKEEVEKGNFREDLYYRLNVVNIEIPPLRERKEDIPLLAKKFLDDFSKEYGKDLEYIDVEAINYLVEHKWKGNVRELQNVIERAVLFADADKEILLPEDLPAELVGKRDEEIEERADMTLKDYEKILIENTLKRNSGNKSKTAKILGIKRQTLYNKIKEYGIEA